MKLSIVIINYRSWDELDRCMLAIQEHAPGFPYEILVVENDSRQPDGEKAFLNRWGSDIKLLAPGENLGFGAGADFGFRKAKGEYFLLLNPDVQVWENSISEGVHFLDANDETGIIGGQLRYPDSTIQDSYRNFPRIPDQFIKRIGFLRSHRSLRKRVSHYLMWGKDPERTEPVDWVVGGFLFIRRKAYEQIGGFDPRYFLFMEDVDLCRQMWKHGWQVVYHPKIKATHGDQRLSAGGILDIFRKKTLRIHLASALKYFWKYKFDPHPRAKK